MTVYVHDGMAIADTDQELQAWKIGLGVAPVTVSLRTFLAMERNRRAGKPMGNPRNCFDIALSEDLFDPFIPNPDLDPC